MILALPNGQTTEDMMVQQEQLRSGFINYLQLKHAAGIINVNAPDSDQVWREMMKLFELEYLNLFEQECRISSKLRNTRLKCAHFCGAELLSNTFIAN